MPQPYQNQPITMSAAYSSLGLGDDLVVEAESQNEQLRKRAQMAAKTKDVAGAAGASPLSNSVAMQSLFGGVSPTGI